jgi:peptidoglycan/xylan/chitin deacetylase (PgdA/CDA1 family)
VNFSSIQLRVRNKLRRLLIAHFSRLDFPLRSETAYISFSFDDFPLSAFLVGGRILQKYGVHGTYYVSMRLLNQETSVGLIVSREELQKLVKEGHEVGCHTFDHLDGTVSGPRDFEQSIEANLLSYQEVIPDGRLGVFAYPLDGPDLRVKHFIRNHFICCRGGGQTFNQGLIDLALLKAYFLDWRNADDMCAVKDMIARNNAARGWLIFATHDIAKEPTRYGCRPEFFEEVVRLSVSSGARVLPVMKVCEELQIVSCQAPSPTV